MDHHNDLTMMRAVRLALGGGPGVALLNHIDHEPLPLIDATVTGPVGAAFLAEHGKRIGPDARRRSAHGARPRFSGELQRLEDSDSAYAQNAVDLGKVALTTWVV